MNEEDKYNCINFFTLQAFAWFSDLLVEHTEIFWSLFAVDMDSVIVIQPPDTWEAFPLFQVLNNYLRVDGKDKESERKETKELERNLSSLH